jgi:murein DD-endopeptidase MepM/ murein hydrolase activator NlpD
VARGRRLDPLPLQARERRQLIPKLGAVALCCLANAPAWAQDSVPAPWVETKPDSLAEGTVGWVRVSLPDGATIASAEAGGEPLHFHPVGAHALHAVIAVPVGVRDSLPVSLILQRSDRVDTASVALAVQRTAYSDELLSVPPQYARPDSAAAARIQTEIARSRQLSRDSHTRRRLWRGPFRLPRTGRITSGFGTARIYNGEVQSRHLGTDFAGAIGSPVRAAGPGVVALVADFYLAGRVVYIDHGAGLTTGYFHLSRIHVKQGQRVVAGQVIGAVGRSGRVTGPHLHWVARYGAISVDPLSLLKLQRLP